MAEVVQRNLEGMVPELEDMFKKGLFNRKEIQDIVRRRTTLEYSLQRKSVKKIDYLRYIEFEINLNQLRKKRKTRIAPGGKHTVSDASIQKHVHFLYNRATQRFPGDIDLWLQLFEYATKNGSNSKTVAKILGKAVSLNPLKPVLWVRAAAFQAEVEGDMDGARRLFLRALRYDANQSDTSLWLAMFRFEVNFVLSYRARWKGVDADKEDDLAREELVQQTAFVQQGGLTAMVFARAVKAIADDLDFVVSFLGCIPRLPCFTATLEGVYIHLEKQFSRHPAAVVVRATRILQPSSTTSLSQIHALSLKTELSALQLFEQALSGCQGKKHADLWLAYAEFALDRVRCCVQHGVREESRAQEDKKKRKRQQECSTTVEVLSARLLGVFRDAKRGGALTEALCKLWTQVLCMGGNPCQAAVVAEDATTRFPCAVELWDVRARVALQIDPTGTDSACKVLREGVKRVGHTRSAPLWLRLVEYTLLSRDWSNSSLHTLFMEALSSRCDGHNQLRQRYVEWALQHVDQSESDPRRSHPVSKADEAVRMALSHSAQETPSAGVFQSCVQAAQRLTPPNQEHIRRMFTRGTDAHGEECRDLWLAFIEWESGLGELERSSRVYTKALKTLQNEHDRQQLTKVYQSLV